LTKQPRASRNTGRADGVATASSRAAAPRGTCRPDPGLARFPQCLIDLHDGLRRVATVTRYYSADLRTAQPNPLAYRSSNTCNGLGPTGSRF
jgi:hypothetical protein